MKGFTMITSEYTANSRSDAAAGDTTIVLARHAHWLLRGALASVFIFHGIDKFLGAGIGGFAQMMGFPTLLALMVALGEIGAGAAVLLGGLMRNFYGDALTRLGGLGVFGIMVGAVFLAHWGQWHFMPSATHPMGGMQFQVTLMLVGIYLFIKGNER
jgi:putative oxidoreductase